MDSMYCRTQLPTWSSSVLCTIWKNELAAHLACPCIALRYMISHLVQQRLAHNLEVGVHQLADDVHLHVLLLGAVTVLRVEGVVPATGLHATNNMAVMCCGLKGLFLSPACTQHKNTAVMCSLAKNAAQRVQVQITGWARNCTPPPFPCRQMAPFMLTLSCRPCAPPPTPSKAKVPKLARSQCSNGPAVCGG